MPRGRTQAHEKDLQWLFVRVALGIGIGLAFGIEIAVDGHFDSDADTDSDPGISRYQLYFRSRINVAAMTGMPLIRPYRV